MHKRPQVEAMTPDDALPGCDDLDVTIHEPKPLKLRERNEADVIEVCALAWGCGFTETHRRLRRMNFVDFEFQGASNG